MIKKLGVALVGLGTYSKKQLAPALEETVHCRLAGIVTGSEQKAGEWQRKYNIPFNDIYQYENLEEIRNNDAIDIIYIVLPNSMHKEYVVRAASTGKHIICEKPMAISTEDCRAMIDACNKAGVMLSIGYRLHFEPFNAEIMRLGQQKVFGEIRTFYAENGISEVQGWRLDKNLAGGGPLMDVGIYCVQAARYTTGMEPLAVSAQEGKKTNPEKFKCLEESLTWQMEFENGLIAECKASYTEEMNSISAECENGWFKLSPAYEYKGLNGETSNGTLIFPQVNQQAKQMDDFALCIKQNRKTSVPGEMGLQDIKIINAIYEAMSSGKRIEIK